VSQSRALQAREEAVEASTNTSIRESSIDHSCEVACQREYRRQASGSIAAAHSHA